MDKLEEEIWELVVEVRVCVLVVKIVDELGDFMFCCVNLVWYYKLDLDMVMI